MSCNNYNRGPYYNSKYVLINKSYNLGQSKAFIPKQPYIKKGIFHKSINPKMDSNLKRKISDSEDPNTQAKVDDFLQDKKIKTETSTENSNILSKTAIQIIHEIKHIQPVKFQLISSEGPAHKPIFKYLLMFCLNNDMKYAKEFTGEGNSIKQAKKMASIKGINYLLSLNLLFTPADVTFLKSVIEMEFKSFNFEKTFDEYFNFIPKDITVKPEENITIENKLASPSSTLPTNSWLTNTHIDDKSRDIIASNNPMIIFNYFFSTITYTFNTIDVSVAQSNLFKVELEIKKDEKLVALCNKYNKFFLSNKIKFTENSMFMNENENEYKFFNFGNSKKMARMKVAKLALSSILNLISDPISEKYSFCDNNNKIVENIMYESEHLVLKEFADNASEIIKMKYYELLKIAENKTQTKKKNSNAAANNEQLVDSLDEELDEITTQNKLRNVYAAIIQSNGFDISSIKIICITTGTKCISGELMSQTGLALNDWYNFIFIISI
jgi:hypothetical protein